MIFKRWLSLTLAACMLAVMPLSALAEVVEAPNGLEIVDVSTDSAAPEGTDVACDSVEAPIDEVIIDLGDEPVTVSNGGECDLAAPEAIPEPMPLMAPMFEATGVYIDEATFPDENFFAWVLEMCDIDGNGWLSESEIARVTTMDLRGLGIASLAGIERFTALERLDCSDNKLTELDITNCPGLIQQVQGAAYQIKDNVVYYGQLDEDKNLVKGVAYDMGVALVNNTPTEAPTTSAEPTDTASPTESVEPTTSTEPTTSAEPTVTAEPSVSPKPTTTPPSTGVSINASAFPDPGLRIWVIEQCDTDRDSVLSGEELWAVTRIDAPGQEIRSLKGVEIFPNLTEINCDNNLLTALDLGDVTNLEVLSCSGNALSTLNVGKNTALRELNCSGNGLTALDVSKNAALEVLICSGNRLTTLNVDKNPGLRELDIEYNDIKKLDVSLCPKLCAVNRYENRHAIPGGAIAYHDAANTGYISLDSAVALTPSPAVPVVEFSGNLSLTANVGDLFRVDMTDKTIKTAKTSASIVAVADKTGLVNPRSAGKARITFTATDKKRRVLTLTVVDPTMPTAIELDQGSAYTLALQDTLALSYTLLPDTAVTGVTWFSNNTKVATVSADGVVRPKKTGSTTIYATTKRGKKIDKVKITVVDPTLPTGVAILEPESRVIALKGTLQLTAVMTPDGKAESPLTWASRSSAIASVDKHTGLVTGRKTGSATITVTTRNNKTAKIKLTVVDPDAPIGVEIDDGDQLLSVGDTFDLSATVSTLGGTTENAALTWKSSNKKVATVSTGGVITAKKTGITRITVTTKNGKKDTITVTVTD